MSPTNQQPVRGWRRIAASIAPTRQPAAAPDPQPAKHAASPGARPVFVRLPRRQIVPPQEQITLRPPPPAPTPPSAAAATGSVISMVWGTILGVLTGGPLSFMALVKNAGGLGSAASYGLALRKHGQATKQRVQSYHAELASLRQRLETLRDQQRAALLSLNYDSADCLARAEALDSQLWDRSPGDPDFLDVRLGLAAAAASFTIVVPQLDEPLASDPLWLDAQRLAAEFTRIDDAPVVLPLKQIGIGGMIGARGRLQDVTRAMLVQIAARHAPSDLKLALFFPDSERESWEWTRWPPHVWSDDRSSRYIAIRPQQAQALLAMLESELRHRQQASDALDTASHLLVVIADPDLAAGSTGDSLIHLIQSKGRALGVSALVLDDREHKEWSAVVDLTGDTACLRLATAPANETCFTPDRIARATADAFARKLAPVRLEGVIDAPPPVVPLLEVLDADRVEDLRVADRWRRNAPFNTLAVPVGVLAGGGRFRLNIHERGHGPHGIVVGDPSSGKSELLRSLIVSLAVHYHPDDIGFYVIEYRPNRFADAFAQLPHQLTVLTTSGPGQDSAALHALQAEQQRREQLFDQAGVRHIDDYSRLQRQGQVAAPLPHLLLISDSFAELTRYRPEVAQELANIALFSQHLGFHLLLATQRPSVLLGEDIVSSARYRLCLRLKRREDSEELLDHSGATTLRHAGRAYVRVGQNELLQQFQAAWSGAAYSADDRARTIAEVQLDGTRQVFAQRTSRSSRTQLEAIVEHLKLVAQQEGIQAPQRSPDSSAGNTTAPPPVVWKKQDR